MHIHLMGHRQDSVLAGLYGCIVQPSVLLSVGRTDVHPRTGQMVVLYIYTVLPIHLAGQIVVLLHPPTWLYCTSAYT